MSRFDFAKTSVYRLPAGESVLVRAIRPHDAARLQGYFQALSAASRRNRFLGAVNQVAPSVLARLTSLPGAGQLAFVALADGHDGAMIGETVQVMAPGGARGEIALSVMDAWQRRGLGTLLMQHIECQARRIGARHLFGEVLRTNPAMKGLARKTGFSIASPFTDARLIEIVKDLAATPPGPLCDEQLFPLPSLAA